MENIFFSIKAKQHCKIDKNNGWKEKKYSDNEHLPREHLKYSEKSRNNSIREILMQISGGKKCELIPLVWRARRGKNLADKR